MLLWLPLMPLLPRLLLLLLLPALRLVAAAAQQILHVACSVHSLTAYGHRCMQNLPS
jgi:hypothetical protein